jgi:adenine-specific DNA-methyltransferase
VSTSKSQQNAHRLHPQMSDVTQFRSVEAWRVALGLLPVPLRETLENQERYVLLNGTSGNFCLDFIGGTDPILQRAVAWSCDVGHYLTLIDDSIVVNRWDKQSSAESYSCQSVISQLHEFHRHLERTAPDRSRNIVAHVLSVFRQIRTAVGEHNNGLKSLRVLLHLLASAATDQYRLKDEEFAVWGLAEDAAEASLEIPDATWRPLHNDLSGTGRYDVLRPDFDLVLRHASGAVFQDAHLEAQLSPNLWLPGFEIPAGVDRNATPSETGTYFTPPALARTLAEEATADLQGVPGRPLLLFDPACGSGELLKECLRLLKLKGYPGQVRVIAWDKSPISVEMARFVLACEKRAWPADRVKIEVLQNDSLSAAANWPADVDIVAMNPPFKAWNRMEGYEQDAVTRILGASNKPNLAMAFARRALDILNDRGTLAMIAPNSLLEASSGKPVREALAEMLTPQLIARLGDQSVFARALVDAGMYVGKRRAARMAGTAILWADSRPNSLNRALRALRRWRGAEVQPINDDGFSVYGRDDVGRSGAPWIARAYEAYVSFQTVRHTRRTIPAKKVFDIKQGVRLGNDVFIIHKEYFEKLKKNERRFFRPAVMNLSLSEGKLNDNYYVFYPYTEGLPAIETEEDLVRHAPTYYKDFLLQAKSKLAGRKSLRKPTSNGGIFCGIGDGRRRTRQKSCQSILVGVGPSPSTKQANSWSWLETHGCSRKELYRSI